MGGVCGRSGRGVGGGDRGGGCCGEGMGRREELVCLFFCMHGGRGG